MDFLTALLIPTAYAQDAGAAGGGLMSFIPLILIFVIFWFLLIRPQMKRAKEHRQLVAALAVGDEIITTGGLLGRITEVGESFLAVELASGVTVRLQKQAVSQVLPKGTFENQ